ncbi:MAG: molecular chaperone HtpG [Planctomycetes bacterium]|jgi:molecular chaperone HtpG|nr:molecular chaperone HtpG [Planctomycetota bacterium]MDP6410688.1 molecular chaperone HtpG [Planctomycetota bacterium]
MTETAETRPFEAQVQELLNLMIHSLYTEKEIFLRELVSNASDALDKLRFENLTQPDLGEGDEELAITLEVNADARTLSVIDNGIGMDRDELIANLGTIASSGTQRFLEEISANQGASAPDLIGQFGVGFYSSFMVAEEVSVVSRKAGEEDGYRWRSEADGNYTIEPAPGAKRGTCVTLLLSEREGDESETPDFLDEGTLRALVRRSSDFVEYPIRLGDDVLNSQKPLWARPKADLSDDDYREFYQHLTHDWHAPAETIHFKAEGASEFTALVYIPSARPANLFGGEAGRTQLSLYVRRVFITAECEDLLPPWLRFVRGVVEASDLPLNVSREILQANPHVRQIRRSLTKKILGSLESLRERDREAYDGVWNAFGTVLKEGICTGEDEDGRIAGLALFESSRASERTTLGEYVERMGEEQEAIWTLLGPDRATLDASPLVEPLRSRGWEVIYLTDPVDEWMVDRLSEFTGKPLRSVHAADLDLADEEGEERASAAAQASAGLLEALNEHLGEEVKEVRFSTRLVESPAVLVSEAGPPRPHLERALREGGMAPDLPGPERILELHPGHPLIERLCAMHAEAQDDPRLFDFADLLHGQALLAEGTTPRDPARFARLVTELMTTAP